MRFIVILAAVFGSTWAAPQYDVERAVIVGGLIEDGLNKTINDLLANLTDPINLDSLVLDFSDSDLLSGGLNATNVVVNGVKSIAASAIHLDIFQMALTLNIHVTELLVNFKYWADMVLAELVPLYGDGRMNVVLEEINIGIAGSANLTGGLSLKNITVTLGLEDATFDLNGLINNPEFSALVSTALNDNFVTFVDNNSEVISSIISPIVEELLNSILGGGDDDGDSELQKLIAEYQTLKLN